MCSDCEQAYLDVRIFGCSDGCGTATSRRGPAFAICEQPTEAVLMKIFANALRSQYKREHQRA